MGKNKKFPRTDDFQIFCNVFTYTNRYRNDYKNPSIDKNNYTVAEIRYLNSLDHKVSTTTITQMSPLYKHNFGNI